MKGEDEGEGNCGGEKRMRKWSKNLNNNGKITGKEKGRIDDGKRQN